MNVAELITALQKMDPELEVFWKVKIDTTAQYDRVSNVTEEGKAVNLSCVNWK